VKVSVLLADKGSVNVQQGTLNLLNVGWTQTPLRPAGAMIPGGYMTPAQAVAIFFEVDHKRCNREISLVLELINDDGRPVEVDGPAGPQKIQIAQSIVVQSPAGMPIGSPGTGNALIEIIPGLALPPGGYEWKVILDGQRDEDWSAHFVVLPVPPSPPTFGGPGSVEPTRP
jgi:hypothetical protein